MLSILESQSLYSPRSWSVRSCSIRWTRGPLMLAAAAILNFVLVSQFAQSAPINYGSFSGTTVNYLNVTEVENSPPPDVAPLFGEPFVLSPPATYPATPCVLCAIPGNSLNFDPTGFSASASGAAGSDITDGQLSFTVVAKPGFGIGSISLAEAGDLTLAGNGTNATNVGVAGSGTLNIQAINGVGVFIPSIGFNLTMTNSGLYGLVTDGGASAPFPYFDDWSGSWIQNLTNIIVANGYSANDLVTQISINVDNTLSANSEAGTSALIAKKEFGGLSVTVQTIPEPATWILLAVCGLLGAGWRNR